MTTKEIYKAVLKAEGLTQAQAAEICGYAGQGTVGRYMAYGMPVKHLCELTDKLEGYVLVLEKRTPGGKVKAKYEIDREAKK